ncbi:MAG: bifunctional phosphoribosyl-AMP cyclohydrolase/phosphoribosyl-ATP diphosphatase HisIE [Acidobacteriota bacterium]
MTDGVIHRLKFDSDGLIPAIVQNHESGEVLTLAFMNAESLAQTLQTGETWFWSRSRNELWHKGATSGNTQRVIDIRLDCDGDALLVLVAPRGPACHTGEPTCFFENIGFAAEGLETKARAAISTPTDADIERHRGSLSLVNAAALDLGILLQDLFTLILDRKDHRPENSYTSYLFNSGLDKILKKVGEESAETIIAAKNDGTKELTSEMTDLLYHLLVLMAERDVSLRDIVVELSKRAGRPVQG